MSMSSPSIILYQGLRCTKVPRSSLAAASVPAVVPEPTPFLPVSVQGPEPVTTTLQSSTETADAVSLSSRIAVAPSDVRLVPLPTTSSLSESPPNPESNTDIHISVASPTSHNQTSGLPSTDSSTKPSSSEVLTTSTAETRFMVATPTTNTVTAAFPSATNPLQDFSDRGSEDVNRHTLRTILGSIFGTVGLIALILLMCLLIYRYRRRKPRDDRSLGGSEKLLRNGRHSADSWASSLHAFLSRTSSLSDAPSAPDHHHVPGPNMGSSYAHVRKGSSHLSEPNPNPSEVSLDMQPHIRDAVGGTRVHPTRGDQSLCPDASTLVGSHSPSYAKPISPGIQINQDQHSIYSSERSLGSTIILPGRSSFGSSVQRASYPISISDLGPPGPNDSVTRVSTRSDPFDLEVPPNAMHKRSSGALPRG